MFETSRTRETSSRAVYLIAGAVLAVGVAALLYFLYEPPAPPEDQALVGILHAGDPRYDQYRPYIDLVDTKIQMGLNFARKRILMVSAVVENRGDRPVDVVEVKLIFFNYDKPVGESIHTPIRPGPYTPPIEPRGRRAISFYVEEFPKGWMASHAELELSGFRFAAEE
ncbi:MAG: hypothetical protein Kow00109_07140 [Acidobacteriota bacterium]